MLARSNRLARESGALRQRYPNILGKVILYTIHLNPASHRFEPADLQTNRRINHVLAYSTAGQVLILSQASDPLLYMYITILKEKFVLISLSSLKPFLLIVMLLLCHFPELIDNEIAMNRLRGVCNIVLVRHNEGYDFGSWQAGIFYCQRYLQRVSHLILTNDSCYGPFHEFDILFDRLFASHADVIGLTDSTAIQRHLQSYFSIW